MLVVNAAHLVERLQQLRLLEPEQLDELAGSLVARFAEGSELARELMARGWLTHYQAYHLLEGVDSDLVVGPYALLEQLGEGGMGQVFKARHLAGGHVVALKLVHKEYLDNDVVLRRFLREARAAASLDHPNVVRAFEADEAGGVHYFAMEFVEGIDLLRLVSERGPLPVAEACDYVRQAALGLQHAHERGMVHRDIKPANLLLTPDKVVKVLDMGLARLDRGGAKGGSMLTVEGSMLGTPDFIAPEQARDARGVDIRADLYSLGCTLYYLLAGAVPFPEGSLGEKLLKHILDTPPPLEKWRPGVPPAVTAVMARLMAKRPEDRYQTPAEAAAALTAVDVVARAAPAYTLAWPRPGNAADSESGETIPSGDRLTVLQPRRRWPWVAGGAGVAGVALALLVWWGWPRGAAPAAPDRPGPKKDSTVRPKDIEPKRGPRTPEQAIARLRGLGAKVVLDEGRPGKPVVEVDLAEQPVTDADLAHLEPLGQLEVLDLASTRVTDAGLAHLRGLLGLRKLVLRQTAVGDEGLAHLRGLSNLRELDLQGTKVTDTGLEHLRGLTQLEGLVLNDTPVSDVGMKHLAGLARLAVLGLSATQVGDAGLAYLRGLTDLGELDLGRTAVSDAGLKQLAGLSRLRYLVLMGTKVSDDGLEHLEGLTQLEELHLIGTRVRGPGLGRLRGLTRLRVLSLNGTPTDDAGLKELAELAQLVQLGLNGTMVSDAGLAHLKGLTALRRLDLRNTAVSDMGLPSLYALSQLEEVRLGGTKVGEIGTKELQSALPKVKIER